MLTGGQRMVTKTHSSEIRTPRAGRRPDGHISEKLKTSSHGTAPGVLEDHNESFLDSRHDQRGSNVAHCFRNIRGRGPALNDHGAREESRTFESWGIWTTSKANVTVLAQPEQVHTILIPAAYLRPLGVTPVAGRKLTAADQDQGGKSENGPLRQIESTT